MIKIGEEENGKHIYEFSVGRYNPKQLKCDYCGTKFNAKVRFVNGVPEIKMEEN